MKGFLSGFCLFLTATMGLILANVIQQTGIQLKDIFPHLPHSHPKHHFISKYSKDYGYNGLLDKIRETDLRQVNTTYLDYTGSGLYRTSQIRKISNMYENVLFSNPHSASPSSAMTTEMIESARNRILKFLGTSSKDYTVIFTASATASLRLLAESFPWSSNSLYLYTRDNHNSVLGIRRWALHYGAKFRAVEPSELQGTGSETEQGTSVTSNLFVFPGEENFAGKKYPLEWIRKFKETNFGQKFNKGRWFTCLDAAAYLPTNRLDLSEVPADFVVLSFYKIFGYPNIGALIVRNDVLPLMRKMGFSGGTVVMATCGTDYALLQPRGCSRFEDGTVPFLSIVALNQGFDKLEELGIDRINKHVHCVTRELYLRLKNLRHSNGRPAIKIYGNHMQDDPKTQGGIITFNLMNETGGWIGYNDVMEASKAENVQLRVGCFCNPGACTAANGLSDDQVEEYYNRKTSCHDGLDIINGVPLGAVRLGLGQFTSMEDIEKFDAFVHKYFVH